MANPQPQHPHQPQFDIHDRLRKAREVAGYDQGPLAAIIGISRATVVNYETGNTSATRLKPYVVQRWAEVTGVSYEWISDGVLDLTPPPQEAQAERRRRRNAQPSDQSRCTARVVELVAA